MSALLDPSMHPRNLNSRLSVLEYTYLLFWNSFWTIAPVIAIGLFDRLAGTFLSRVE